MQRLSSTVSGRNNFLPPARKGFIFTMDMAIALSIVLSVLFITQTVPFENNPIKNTLSTQDRVDDVFTFLDTSGYILYTLDTNAPSTAVTTIYNRALSSIPSNMDIRIELQQFVTANLEACKSIRDFDTCFPDANALFVAAGGSLPADKGIIKGKKIFVRRQPAPDCNLTYELAAPPFPLQPLFPPMEGIAFDHHPVSTISLQGGPDLNLVFDVNIVPDTDIICDQNVTINLSVTVPDFVRDPVDIILVVDRSGSMSWVGRLNTDDASRLAVSNGYTYLADGSGDLRVIDTVIPSTPFLAGTGTFSGAAEDVVIDGNYAYVAAGTGSLKIVDISDKNSPSQIGSWDVGNTGRGIDKNGDYVYLAHGLNGLRIIDVSNPASPAITGTWDNDGYSYDVKVKGNYAYVADDDEGLVIIDITNPAAPVFASQCESTSPCSIDNGTNARQVFILGNYLYLSQNENGMRIIDITDPLNPVLTGTYDPSDDVEGIFVVDNNAYLAADDGGLLVVDVTDKTAPTLLRTIPTPYTFRDVIIENGWAHIAADSKGLITINLQEGIKMKQAVEASKVFMDSNAWEPADQTGLASYASGSTLDQQLTNNRSLVKAALDTLMAGGSTATSAGITEATGELTGTRSNPDAARFMIFLSDGRTTTGSSPLAAAATAASNGIIIHTIGFGPDVDASELTEIANIADGNYHAAADANALAAVFAIIEKKIQEAATNATLNAVVADSNFVVSTGGATLVDQNLLFAIDEVSPGVPWFGSYTLNFPCTNALSCSIDTLSLPGSGSFFEYTDSNGLHQITFDVNTTVSFLKRDLTVNITSGRVTAPNNVLIDVNVANIADLNTGSTTLNIYLNDINTTPLTSRFVPELCGGTNSFCIPSVQLYTGMVLNTEGVIYATINDDNAISECPGNNQDVINCFGAPETVFYVLDYWAWRN